MEKLANQSEKNNPSEYDRIYEIRQENGPDEFDMKRWKKLIKFFKGARLLDMGCLDSLVIEMAHKRVPTADLWGIDLAEKAIFDMGQKYPYAIFEIMDIYKTKYPDEFFSYIVSGEVIEHLEYPEKMIKEAMRILKPGGTFALSTPKDEATDIGAVDKERHLWSFSIDDIKNLLSPYGEVKIEVMGSQYFPIYKYKFPTIIAWCKKYGK